VARRRSSTRCSHNGEYDSCEQHTTLGTVRAGVQHHAALDGR
jgi:hypothetical protein